jgi:tetratricopeptide (TPR) repeat protein
MPSHIFTRVGYWKESISSNDASAQAAKAGKELHDQLHAMDYLVYAHLQLAQDREARAVIEEMIEMKGYNPNVRTGPYAVAASRARYMIERNDWKGAAGLQVQPTRFAYVDAVTHFARALGAARSGEPVAARADIAQLAELHAKLQQVKDDYWAEQVEIQGRIATAWALHAEGKHDEALAGMQKAADAEDRTEKSVVTPGPLAPARELYGVMLLERGQAAEALAQFEATLQKEPNRFNAFAGAADSAKRLGDTAKARRYSEKLVALAGTGQSTRPAVAAARQLLAAK